MNLRLWLVRFIVVALACTAGCASRESVPSNFSPGTLRADAWIQDALGGPADMRGEVRMNALRADPLFGPLLESERRSDRPDRARGLDVLTRDIQTLKFFARADGPSFETSSVVAVARGNIGIRTLEPSWGWRATGKPMIVATADKIEGGRLAWRAYAMDDHMIVFATARVTPRIEQMLARGPRPLGATPIAGPALVRIESNDAPKRWLPSESEGPVSEFELVELTLTGSPRAEITAVTRYRDEETARSAFAEATNQRSLSGIRFLGLLLYACPVLGRLQVSSGIQDRELISRVSGLEAVLPYLRDPRACGRGSNEPAPTQPLSPGPGCVPGTSPSGCREGAYAQPPTPPGPYPLPPPEPEPNAPTTPLAPTR